MEKRLDIATRLYETEAGLTAHYESVRMHFLGFIITLTGLVLVLYDDSKGGVGAVGIAVFLAVLGCVSAFAMARFCHASKFHWKLTAKTRQIIARNDEKVHDKYQEVSHAHTERKLMRRIQTDTIWIFLSFFVPVSAGLVILIFGEISP